MRRNLEVAFVYIFSKFGERPKIIGENTQPLGSGAVLTQNFDAWLRVPILFPGNIQSPK